MDKIFEGNCISGFSNASRFAVWLLCWNFLKLPLLCNLICERIDILILTQIGKEEGSGLEKICFAPLTSQFTGPPHVEQCVVQSVWGYFQNSEDTFDETDIDPEGFVVNYLDHFVKCTQ
jgi:hypothetical protein